MMHSLSRCIGTIIVAFGCGLLLAFFLPKSVLIIIEAIVIILAGAFFVTC